MNTIEFLVLVIILFCVSLPFASMLSNATKKRHEKRKQKRVGYAGPGGVFVDGKWLSFSEAEKRRVEVKGYYAPPKKPKSKNFWKVRQ